MSSQRFWAALTFAALTAAGANARATIPVGGGGEVLNEFVTPAAFAANAYSITFQGDVRNQLDLNGMSTNSFLNPFAFYNQETGNTATSNVTATLDGAGNTVVAFTNSVAVPEGYGFGSQTGQPQGMPHLGIGGTSFAGTHWAPLNVLEQSWSNVTGDTFASPGVSLSVAGPATGAASNLKYLVVFVQSDPNAAVAGQWFEASIDGSKPPDFTLTDYTAHSETLSSAGAFVSENFIPLQDLNWTDVPPTGVAGSPFLPLPKLDGVVLQGGDGLGAPGGSITASAVPEPSSIVALGVGVVALAIVRSRRRARAARAAAC